MKNKKVIYETLWTTAPGNTKEYPHGWGFDAPLVYFPQDADPAWCGQMCMKHLSNEEFTCYGAVPKTLLNGNFAFEYPTDAKSFDEWKKTNEYL
jgi:hypothetical protein